MKLRSQSNSRRVRAGLTSPVVATVALLALAVASPARADTVTEWNLNAASAIFVTAGQPPQLSVLDAQYAASLAGIPDGSTKTRGIAVGEAAAAAMKAARTDDGRFGAFRFAVGSAPGVWRPVP